MMASFLCRLKASVLTLYLTFQVAPSPYAFVFFGVRACVRTYLRACVRAYVRACMRETPFDSCVWAVRVGVWTNESGGYACWACGCSRLWRVWRVGVVRGRVCLGVCGAFRRVGCSDEDTLRGRDTQRDRDTELG